MEISNNNNINHNKNSPTNFSGGENNSTNFTSSNNNSNNIFPKRKWIKKISFKSQAGKNESGMIKTNQDSYLIMDNILNNDEFKIFGVLDGHGKKIYNLNIFIMFKFFYKYKISYNIIFI